jgi:hypothetical protein
MEPFSLASDAPTMNFTETTPFAFAGVTYTAGGAYVLDTRAGGYMSEDMKAITKGDGMRLGSARIVASWATPKSYVSSRQYQVECVINGVLYTGRTGGGSLLWRGKAKKSH